MSRLSKEESKFLVEKKIAICTLCRHCPTKKQRNGPFCPLKMRWKSRVMEGSCKRFEAKEAKHKPIEQLRLFDDWGQPV